MYKVMQRSLLLLLVPAFAAADEPLRPDQYAAGELRVPGAWVAEPKIDLSLQRADQHLVDGALAWSRNRKCVSCHTNGSYLFVRPALTKSHGAPSTEIRDFFVAQLAKLKETPEERLQAGTRAAQVVYIAAGLAEWDKHVTGSLSDECRDALQLMFRLQAESGTWTSLDCWPPFESSAYQEATMAAMATATAPGWLDSLDNEDIKERVERLKRYLRDTPAPHIYARVLQLWASQRWNGLLTSEQKAQAIKLVSSHQQADGGWSIRTFATPEQWGKGNRANKIRSEEDFDTPPSDGHMTGLAVLVLQESGISAADERIVKGIAWLESNQRESGRWWTRSLNTDKSHFITYSGTAYAMLALQRHADAKSTVAQNRR